MNPDYTRAANKAYKTIISLKLDRLPIDPLMILKKCRHTAVHTYDEVLPYFGVSDGHFLNDLILEGIDAFTIRKDAGDHVSYELLYNSHANKRRMRFTLAHELGHILLQHHREELWEDKEADYFAAQLLAPRPVFNVLAVRGFDTSNPELIALTFNLSKAAAKIAARTPVHQPENRLYREVADQFTSFADYVTDSEMRYTL